MDIVIMVIFLALSALTLFAGLMVVIVKNIIHAALWLITSFFCVGAIYLLMEAEFLAVVQILVYVGAISILILFAIMLTRHITGEGVRQLHQRWWISMLIAIGLFLIITSSVFDHSWSTVDPSKGSSPQEPIASAVEIGRAFMQEYLLPFEIASILLLVALIGAIVIAFEELRRRRKVLTLAEEVALRKREGLQLPPPVSPNAADAQNNL